MNELDTALHYRQLLAKAIGEKGEDFVYDAPFKVKDPNAEGGVTPLCTYLEYEVVEPANEVEGGVAYRNPTGRPSCIVGHALFYDGRDLVDLERAEGTGAMAIAHTGHQRVDYALAKAQGAQDDGRTWGASLLAYDNDCARNIKGYRGAIK